jgi:DNA polymerase-3 subunit gamma/tau
MAIMRLCYAADLPGPEAALKALQNGQPAEGGGRRPGPPGSSGGGTAATARALQPQAHAGARPQPVLQSFEDVVRLIDEKRDVALKLDVEKYVRPISFRPGAITFEPAPGAPSTLAPRLVARLKEWTGQPWLVAAEGGGGAESLLERVHREKLEVRSAAEADPFVRSLLDAFPGAEIVDVRQLQVEASGEAAPPPEEEE